MIRLLNTTRWRNDAIVHRNVSQPNMCRYRTFFWNGNNGNGSDDDDDSEKKEPKTKREISDKAAVKDQTLGKVRVAPSFEKRKKLLWGVNKSRTGDSTTSAGMGDGLVRLGFGDESPRYPHLIALPVINRPIFPGIASAVNVTDHETISALENVQKSGAGYVGVFLRKEASTGVTDSGLIVDKPELISNPNEIYNVGTFAQIHRINRDVTSNVSAMQSLGNAENFDENREDNNEDGTAASILLLAHRRIDLVSVDSIGPPIDVTVSHWDRLEYNPNSDSKTHDNIRALSNEIVSTIREVAQINPLFREHIHLFPTRVDANDPYRFADFAASIATSSPEELQSILEEKDAEMRLHKALVVMKKELELARLQQEISAKVEEKMSETQRKYFLMEQLKSIKKELGMEQDDKEVLLDKYRKKIKDVKEAIPDEVSTVIESELEKISTLEKNSSEFNVTRSYLDWLTDIPWGEMSEENFDISDARRILDRDHYGLDDVKDIIMQLIAVGKLRGSVQGKILCLAGPPGVGKTSIASSVAEALNRKFFRFSVGGLSDVSEIKGHRRTYVGAMPGKLIQGLKSAGSLNPLVLIDEIDKLGRDFRGDPGSALLEVLDPSQNSTFRDHFLDVPVDMSKVLFMCTANDISLIPGPLLDRMEIVHLSGYDAPEKVSIAEQYLLPKSMLESGLMVKKNEEKEGLEPDENVEVSGSNDEKPLKNEVDDSIYSYAEGVPESATVERSAIESLVRWYCREAGVRNLAKHIDKITRKLALQVVSEQNGSDMCLSEKSKRVRSDSDSWEVTETNLKHYVGKPPFTSDRMYEKDPLPNGVVMGLAWTSMGGSALYVETQGIKRGKDESGKQKGGGNLKVTGQLGDVMSESTQIAYTVSRAYLEKVDPGNQYFDDNDIHLHVPEGATPKDGPSAGVTIITSMLSLGMNRPIKHDLAMTGEVSLTGKVLPVGGIKEKTMAARRAGIKCVVFPVGNKRDFDEIPDYLKEDLEVHFAEEYEDVFQVAFGDDENLDKSI